ALAAVTSLALGQGTVAVAQAQKAPAAAVPDLSGVWLPDSRRSGRAPREPREWPLTPAAQKAVQEYATRYLPIDPTLDDPNVSCIPESLPYAMRLIAQYPFEILTTPGQITIFFEIFGGVRRIYLDGRRMPSDLLPSTMGYSIGRWEGDTLVVETTHVKNEAAGPFAGNPPVSMARRFVERFSLGLDPAGKKELRDEITIHDPAVLTQPVVIPMVYKWSPDIEVGEYLCQQDVWDQNIQGHPSSVPWRH
ncbi:MAG: hypothetical protein ABI859_14740, partial [Pseudomonadota bacterium]